MNKTPKEDIFNNVGGKSVTNHKNILIINE